MYEKECNLLKNKTNKKIGIKVMVLVGCLVTLAAALAAVGRLEGEIPTVSFDSQVTSIGAVKKLSISVSDTRSGLRRVWLGLLKDGKEKVLFEKEYPGNVILGTGQIHSESILVEIDARKLELSDGSAILRMTVHDYSWRGWWHGNRTYVEKEVTIDTRAPEIEILSRAHNINQGGVGLVIYKVSEPCEESGVNVGDNYFPGHSGFFKDSKMMMAFFALGHEQGSDTRLLVRAMDAAGNSAKSGFYYHIRKHRFKKDTLTISDRFLDRKMPEFETAGLISADQSMLNKFLEVNRTLRKVNNDKIVQISAETDNQLHWEGTFLRLPGSATRATFADRRTYLYNKKIVDNQVHMGVDLASVARSVVPAGNSGRVVFTESLGIYGKTVIIDHGFGLFSLYAHLSTIDVKVGQMVSRGEQLGRTGMSGLAGGDHLHFGMIIHNTLVNPIEWWDSSWIENNILSKIKDVRTILGDLN
jgi:hypothetical protein